MRMLGNGRLEAMCIDGIKRLCHIRGKMRKKVWVNTVRRPPASAPEPVPERAAAHRARARRRATSCWSACATTKMRKRTSSSSAPPWSAARPERRTSRRLVARVCQRVCVLPPGIWRTRRAA